MQVLKVKGRRNLRQILVLPLALGCAIGAFPAGALSFEAGSGAPGREAAAIASSLDTALMTRNVHAALRNHVDPATGAIMLNGNDRVGNVVHPWFAFSAALAFLETGEDRDVVRNWLRWACANANDGSLEDVFGPRLAPTDDVGRRPENDFRKAYRPDEWTGTIFTHVRTKDGRIVKRYRPVPKRFAEGWPTGAIATAKTATDNWSASLIITMARYIDHGGREDDAPACGAVVDAAAHHLLALMKTLGLKLTQGAPDIETIYTTDNIFSVEGVSAYAKILNRRGDVEKSAQFGNEADLMARALIAALYDQKAQNFYSYLGQRSFRWSRFYGDAVANVQGVLSTDPEIRRLSLAGWPKFVSSNASWTHFLTGYLQGGELKLADRTRAGKWTNVAYLATLAEDPDFALAFIANMSELTDGFTTFERTPPLTVNELGWLYLALRNTGKASVITGDRLAEELGVAAEDTRTLVGDRTDEDGEGLRQTFVGARAAKIEPGTSRIARLQPPSEGRVVVSASMPAAPVQTSEATFALSCRTGGGVKAVETIAVNPSDTRLTSARRLAECIVDKGEIMELKISNISTSLSLYIDGILIVSVD